jgi:hypothetical protein
MSVRNALTRRTTRIPTPIMDEMTMMVIGEEVDFSSSADEEVEISGRMTCRRSRPDDTGVDLTGTLRRIERRNIIPQTGQ